MLLTIKKKLSYIYPITHRVTSIYNGILEITYIDGKKVLNTMNTNYSFGSLHKVMQFALNRVPIKGNSDILLLGLGGGSVLRIIREELLKENHIDAVDIDSSVIEIARKEFGLDHYTNLTVYCQNAFAFVEEANKKYGLIIIDLFIDRVTSDYFYSTFFWTGLMMLAKKKCAIVFNTLTINNSDDEINSIRILLNNAGFEVHIYPEVERSNMILIAKRGHQ